MLKEKAALFTIGQFAALHEINKKTLMWYDEIGLLKPACIKEDGYRYYSYQQSAALETILMLRELNVSLDEIKQFMENRTIDNFASLLQEKITELNQTISHLRSIQKNSDQPAAGYGYAALFGYCRNQPCGKAEPLFGGC